MDYYEETLKKFSESYQYLYKYLDSWEPLNNREILVVLEDGRTYSYDGISRLLRKVKIINNVSEFTDEEWRIGFSDLLARFIRKSGITQYELADRIGISTVMMSRYSTGKSAPTPLIMQKIARELDCSIDDLCPKEYIYLK